MGAEPALRRCRKSSATVRSKAIPTLRAVGLKGMVHRKNPIVPEGGKDPGVCCQASGFSIDQSRNCEIEKAMLLRIDNPQGRGRVVEWFSRTFLFARQIRKAIRRQQRTEATLAPVRAS